MKFKDDLDKNPIILAKPAFKVASGPSQGTSCISFYTRMRKRGFTIIEWTPWKMLFGRYDILHLHWPDNILSDKYGVIVFVKLVLFFAALAMVRVRGKFIVWTAHNLESHEKRHPWLESLYWKIFAGQIDGVIAPLKSIQRKVQADDRFTKVREVCFLPFGDWRDCFCPGASRLEVCDRLGIAKENKVVLWFGAVRQYKGVDELIKLFTDEALQDITLVVAGGCRETEYQRQIEQLGRQAPNVLLRLKFVPDHEVGDLFNLADICVFPFREITNTGSVRLALTFHRHVVVPEFPFAIELKEVLGEKWFTSYPPGKLSTEHIFRALDVAERLKGQTVEWGEYNWDTTSEKAECFFERIVQGGKQV